MFHFLSWAEEGGLHRFSDYQLWLQTAGFCEIKQINEKWLFARK
jgi:hypothetical protein